MLTALERPGLAIRASRMAVQLAPNDSDVHLDMGLLALTNNRPAVAKSFLEKSIKINPDSAITWNGLGVSEDALGNFIQARKSYQKALILKENAPEVRSNLAFSYILSGSPEKAVDILEPLVHSQKATVRQRQNLALAYGLLGQRKKARELASLDLSQEAVSANMAFYSTIRNNHEKLIRAGK